MEKINQIIGKYGVLILLCFTVLNFFSTCGTKGKIQQNNKRIENLEQTITRNDSLNREIQSIEREISNLEIAREVVYTNNAIVRQVTRPDDVMNDYSNRIKDLQKKLDKVKNEKK